MSAEEHVIDGSIPPISELREIAQSTKTSADRRLSYRLFRLLSIYVTRALLYTPTTANQVTVLSILTGVAGIVLIAQQSAAVAIAGYGVMFLYHILDKVDGEIARARNNFSIHGIYLDNIGHHITGAGLILGSAFRLATTHDASAVPILFVGVIGGIACILYRAEKQAPFHLYSQHVMGFPELVESLPEQGASLTRESIKNSRKQDSTPVFRRGPVAIVRELLLTLASFHVSAMILLGGVSMEAWTGSVAYSLLALVAVCTVQVVAYVGVEFANLSQNLVAECKRLHRRSKEAGHQDQG
jgi:phosphatidylglycerophosphate synthase